MEFYSNRDRRHGGRKEGEMSFRSRLERLERRRPACVSFWDVLWGGRDLEDLDDAGKAMLQQLVDFDPSRDPIEEEIAALSGPATPPPPTGDPCSTSPDNGDDAD
jgi:hypothetical protein